MTHWIAQHGVLAVFVLMAADALLPVGGELVMLYAGALAAGAVGAAHVGLLGASLASGAPAYVVLAAAGTLGYLAGALIGWGLGARGGRPFVERRGRWLHLGPDALPRAERWFDRFGTRAVLFGRITPVVRSFISIPAGVLGSPLVPYTLLTLLGSAIWCFGFAGAGWALGGSWERFHHDFRYADYAAVAAVVVLVAIALLHRRRARQAQAAAGDDAGGGTRTPTGFPTRT